MEVVLSRLDRSLVGQNDLEEQALRIFEPKLRALNLGLDQIDKQTLLELEASLERIADAMRHPEQYGTFRLKMTADAGVVVARSTSEAHFEAGIYPFLVQRKVRILDRIRLLRPTGELADLRQQIVQGIEDLPAREDLLAMIDAQNDQISQASCVPETKERTTFYKTTIGTTRTWASRRAREAIGLIKLAIAVLVVFAAVAVAVPSLLGSPPRWVPVALAALVALPVALDVLDKLAPSGLENGTRSPLKRLEARAERVLFLRRLSRSFATQGVEDLAIGAGAAGILDPAEVSSLSAKTRKKNLLRARWLAISVLAAVTASTSAVIWWKTADRDISVRIGQSVDLADVYRLTVTAPPTCTVASAANEARCTVTIRLTNISGEDQDIGAGSFGKIGPKGPTYYYTRSPEIDGQDYAIAAVVKGQYFRLNSNSTFDKNSLRAGDSTYASLEFDVRDGVNHLDEIQLAERAGSQRIHVRLAPQD